MSQRARLNFKKYPTLTFIIQRDRRYINYAIYRSHWSVTPSPRYRGVQSNSRESRACSLHRDRKRRFANSIPRIWHVSTGRGTLNTKYSWIFLYLVLRYLITDIIFIIFDFNCPKLKGNVFFWNDIKCFTVLFMIC